MTIELAQDENEVDIDLDSHVVHSDVTFYDVLHMMIHNSGTEAWVEAIAKAREYAAAHLTEGGTGESFCVSVPVPNVLMPIAMLEDALTRFNETHDAEELKAAVKGAQATFGGPIGKLLQALAVLGPDEDEAPIPKTNLH